MKEVPLSLEDLNSTEGRKVLEVGNVRVVFLRNGKEGTVNIDNVRKVDVDVSVKVRTVFTTGNLF